MQVYPEGPDEKKKSGSQFSVKASSNILKTAADDEIEGSQQLTLGTKRSSFLKDKKELYASQTIRIDKPAPTAYQRLLYKLNILVPTDDEAREEYHVPRDHYLQTVLYGKLKRYRVLRRKTHGLPENLNEPRDAEYYRVFGEEQQGMLSVLDLASPFLRKWDNFTLILLLFTAIVTPFETA